MWPLRRTPVPAWIALLSALPFAACAPRTVPQDIPLALTEVPRPAPLPADPTDRDVAMLIIAQDEALQACYSQMDRIRSLLGPR